MEYTLTKFVHVLLAIVAVGFNASYGIWLARAAKEPQAVQSHVLRTIKVLDDRFANPAYALLIVTGLFMVVTAGYPLTTLWIAAALAIYVLLVVVAIFVYSPTLREQIRLMDSTGPATPEYARAAARGRVVGILLAVAVVVIVFLMVTKPTLS
jgi:uncharacterized membrane protein